MRELAVRSDVERRGVGVLMSTAARETPERWFRRSPIGGAGQKCGPFDRHHGCLNGASVQGGRDRANSTTHMRPLRRLAPLLSSRQGESRNGNNRQGKEQRPKGEGQGQGAAGKVTGNDRLRAEGQTDQVKGNLKQAGE